MYLSRDRAIVSKRTETAVQWVGYSILSASSVIEYRNPMLFLYSTPLCLKSVQSLPSSGTNIYGICGTHLEVNEEAKDVATSDGTQNNITFKMCSLRSC